MSFGREKAWLGAALAAFGVGCGDAGDVKEMGDKEIRDKDVKVEKAPEEILGQDEVVDDELYVPGEEVMGKVERPACIPTKSASEAGRGNVESGNEERWKEEKGKEDVEIESMAFRNILMEEADGIKPGDWMGDEYDKEVARLKEKLPKELSEHKFNNSLEQLHRFFATPKDEEKRKKEEEKGVICLLKATEDGKFFVNKEYKEQVKKFAEKYGAQYGVPVEVIYGVMGIENGGKHDPRKNTADGAYGIMQVQPRVVEDLRRIFPKEDWSGVSVADIEGNIRAGVAYLSYLHGRYGQWSFALMAYNSGPGRFENRMAGGEEEKLKIRKKKGGWKKHLENKNLWWACSRNGRGFLENGNASYAADAMYLSKPMHEIMQSQGGEVKLTPLTEDMK